MEKRDRTEIDTQRENELIDQWTMLQVRMAIGLFCPNVSVSLSYFHLPLLPPPAPLFLLTCEQWERMAVVQPKAGSGVPGAPTNWQLMPGMESRIPVIFLDLTRCGSGCAMRARVYTLRLVKVFISRKTNLIWR